MKKLIYLLFILPLVFSDSVGPFFIFNFQDPADIGSTNLFGRLLNVSYNITDVDGVKNNSVVFYHKVNNTIKDQLFFRNGTSVGGWSTKAIISNIGNTWYFKVNDNEIYPATYNYNETIMENTPHLNYSLNTAARYIKTRFFNISNVSKYNMFEFMAYKTANDATGLEVFYCNSSYVNGNPTNSPLCTHLGTIPYNTSDWPETVFNHSHSDYSKHYVSHFQLTQQMVL